MKHPEALTEGLDKSRKTLRYKFATTSEPWTPSRDAFRRYLRHGEAGLTRRELRKLRVGRKYIWQPGIEPGEPDRLLAMPFPLEIVKRVLVDIDRLVAERRGKR